MHLLNRLYAGFPIVKAQRKTIEEFYNNNGYTIYACDFMSARDLIDKIK